MGDETTGGLDHPARWGLPPEATADLGPRLHQFWERCSGCFKAKTRDAAGHARTCLRGLMLTKPGRNFANRDRHVTTPDGDGQGLQQFMSDWPWVAQSPMRQVQREMSATLELQHGGVVLLDESSDGQVGAKSAGAGRQHNGRLGQIEMSQTGVFLAFYKDVVWTWVDGELFLPEHWFTPDMAGERQRVGVPAERQFATKIALGWRMIQRAQTNGLPFEAVACDDLSGRSGWLRREMDAASLLYMADVPENTRVYLTRPEFGVPTPKAEPHGRRSTRSRVLSAAPPLLAQQVAQLAETHWRRFRVRSTERGELDDPFAMRRVGTIRDGHLAEECLVIRHEYGQRYTCAIGNGLG